MGYTILGKVDTLEEFEKLKSKKEPEFTIKVEPFSWNDNFSEVALEDFSMVQKKLPYGICQSIGMALAKLEELQDIRNELLEMAADEGRHASILKSYTGEVLKPSGKQAEEIVKAFKSMGKEKVFEIMAESEFKAGPAYEKLGESFEKLKDIAKDEIKHGNMLKSFIYK